MTFLLHPYNNMKDFKEFKQPVNRVGELPPTVRNGGMTWRPQDDEFMAVNSYIL